MTKPELHEHTLPNGLKLIGESNSQNKSAAIGYFVKTGSRDEVSVESGVSHFLEHMMFKGSSKRDALQITFDLGNIGAQANAFTSDENTVYYAAIIPEYFSAMQELLSDMLRPALVQEEFDTEKKVILEEIALYQDRPTFYLFEHAMSDYFVNHSAGNSVLGSTESVSGISSEQMRSYFGRRYVPNNMVLVASGKFDWKKFCSDAEQLCGSWKGERAGRELPGFQSQAVEREYRRKGLNQSHVLYMSDSCSAQSEDRYALALLSCIIGDSSGSRLYWDLVDKGLAESAGADNDEKEGVGCFMAYASTEIDRLEEVSQILKRVISTPLEFSAEDLERAKTKIVSRTVLDGELPMGRLMSLGMEWNYRGRLHKLSEQIEQIRSVTRQDIERAVKKYPMQKWSQFRMVPE